MKNKIAKRINNNYSQKTNKMQKIVKTTIILNLIYSVLGLGVANLIFELDGNALTNNINKEDWDTLFFGLGNNSAYSGVINDPPPLSTFVKGGI